MNETKSSVILTNCDHCGSSSMIMDQFEDDNGKMVKALTCICGNVENYDDEQQHPKVLDAFAKAKIFNKNGEIGK
mgnify:CR=1 FL=1